MIQSPRRPPLAWLVAIVSLLMAASLAADTVSGYVLDAETDQRLADVEVAFLVADEGGGMAEMVRRNTDGSGTFSFSGPFLAAGTPFGLVAHYGGLEYATETLEVGAQDQVIIEVFDGTEEDDEIRIDGHHLFLVVTEAGIDVAQLLYIDNLGSSTYVGHTAGDERHVVQLQVPEGNVALRGHSGQISRSSATRLFTNVPLPPGRSQVAFTIQLRGEEFDGAYEHQILYPTSRLELFLQPSDIELPAALFQDLGQMQLHDQEYRHYRVQSLDIGRRVSIPLPFSLPLRWSLKWVMLVFVVAMVAAATALVRPAPVLVTEKQDEERQLLLEKLAALDDRLATATGTEAEQLRQQRQTHKARLTLLYRQFDDDGRG